MILLIKDVDYAGIESRLKLRSDKLESIHKHYPHYKTVCGAVYDLYLIQDRTAEEVASVVDITIVAMKKLLSRMEITKEKDPEPEVPPEDFDELCVWWDKRTKTYETKMDAINAKFPDQFDSLYKALSILHSDYGYKFHELEKLIGVAKSTISLMMSRIGQSYTHGGNRWRKYDTQSIIKIKQEVKDHKGPAADVRRRYKMDHSYFNEILHGKKRKDSLIEESVEESVS